MPDYLMPEEEEQTKAINSQGQGAVTGTAGGGGGKAAPTPGAGPASNLSGTGFINPGMFAAENPANAGPGAAGAQMAAQEKGLATAEAQGRAGTAATNTNLENQYQGQEQNAFNLWAREAPSQFQKHKNLAGRVTGETFEGQGFNPNTSPGTELAPTLEGYTPSAGVTAAGQQLQAESRNPAAALPSAQTAGAGELNQFLTGAENPGLGPGWQTQVAPAVQASQTGTVAPTAAPFAAPYNYFQGEKIGNFGFGGEVPGQAKVDGDSYANDDVPLRVPEHSIVLPRSVTQAPDEEDKAVDFVKNEHLRRFIKGRG